ncbi:MAG: hypothetical protein GY786_20670, partial [Proteobacteria bacterium]|nr:hypothetical protein [Pseudomonadota bacterium]
MPSHFYSWMLGCRRSAGIIGLIAICTATGTNSSLAQSILSNQREEPKSAEPDFAFSDQLEIETELFRSRVLNSETNIAESSDDSTILKFSDSTADNQMMEVSEPVENIIPHWLKDLTIPDLVFVNLESMDNTADGNASSSLTEIEPDGISKETGKF